jgi:PAS domain S-box-containing protein
MTEAGPDTGPDTGPPDAADDLAGLRRLHELYARLAVETDLDAALRDILAAAVELTGTDRGVVQRVSKDGERLEFAVHQGYGEGTRFTEHFRYEGAKAACDSARKHRERMIIEDIASFPSLAGTIDREIALAEDICATLSTPMVSRSGELIGVLNTQFRKPHRPSERELRLMDMLAWTAAGFIERQSAADATLRQSEERYRTLFDAIDEGFYFGRAVFDAEGRCTDILYDEENPAAVRMTGHSAKGQRLSELGDYEEFWREVFGEVARTGEARRLEHYAAPDGIWYDFYVFKPPQAEADEFAVVFRDVTERRRAEEGLRTSEERLRLIVESARDYAIFTTDADGLISGWYPGAEAVFGWPPEEAVGAPADMTFTPEDRAQGAPEQERATAREEGRAPNVRWHLRKDGSRVFIEGAAVALRSEAGLTGFLKIGQDVTARMRAQEHERMLLAELQHRVRNTLAVVRSIARRTAESSATVEEMSDHLQGRLAAFSRVQAAVTRDPTGGVDLTNLVEDELLAHATREGPRLRIEGGDIALQPKAAESISLAIHELTTNAVKYGALSGRTGAVEVRWGLENGGGGGERLRFEWVERGAAPPANDARPGFGTELLLRTLPYELDAETRMDFNADGMRFEMLVPAQRALAVRSGAARARS